VRLRQRRRRLHGDDGRRHPVRGHDRPHEAQPGRGPPRPPPDRPVARPPLARPPMTDAGPEPPVVGFIGLGQIGAPMATRLADWPGGLIVFDVRAAACDEVVAKGARRAESVAALGAEADVVSVMVLNDEQVHAVVADLLTTTRPGTVIAIHSTIR